MIYKLTKPDKSLRGTIYLTSSKSESNRALIIQALTKKKFRIRYLSEADDTKTLQEILKSEEFMVHNRAVKNLLHEVEYNVGPAGTTMRFLISYFATRRNIVRTLSGSQRMKERPVSALCNALKQIGADITFTEKDGYPPVRISGKELTGSETVIDGTISSQYISSLLMIAPTLRNGLSIRFEGEIISRPYILMTLKIMEHFGIKAEWMNGTITIPHAEYAAKDFSVEADWSSASYWYSMAALAEDVDLKIIGLRKHSLQGDSIIASMGYFFGVKTEFLDNGIRLTKTKRLIDRFAYDFSDCPDIALTIAVLASALQMPMVLNGVQSLKIKETNRIQAIINELAKIGVAAENIRDCCIDIKKFTNRSPDSSVIFLSYDDHRMTMSLSPLAFTYDGIKIENPDCVKKSYPDFWRDLRNVGFRIEER